MFVVTRTEIYPIVTFFLLLQITSQWYSRLTRPLEKGMARALEDDIRLDLSRQSTVRLKKIKE